LNYARIPLRGKIPARTYKEVGIGEDTVPYGWDDNVGILTGHRSGIVVVDLDIKNGHDGLGSFEKLATGQVVPETFTVKTKSGGFHLYFVHGDADIRNSASKLGDGVDIRGEGGFVVAPGDGNGYTVIQDLPVAPLPGWLAAILRSDERVERAPSTRPPLGEAELSYRLKLASDYVASAPAAIEGQGGSLALWNVACKLVCTYELPDSVCDAFMANYNARCLPPWSEDELFHKLAGAERSDLPRGCAPAWWDSFTQKARALPKESEEVRFDLTDTGNARRFQRAHGEDVKYVPDWKEWLCWNGTKWEKTPDCLVVGLTEQVVYDIAKEADEIKIDKDRLAEALRAKAHKQDLSKEEEQEIEASAKKLAILKWANTSQSGKHRTEMSRLFRKYVSAKPIDFNTNPWLLSTPEVTIDLRTGKPHDHDKTNLFTQSTEAVYDPEAQCPVWTSFLDTMFSGDPEMLNYIQRSVGYSLTGSVREKCLFFLWGSGDNGKSVFADLLMSLLGEFATTAPSKLLVSEEEHPAGMAKLFGARLAVCQEAEKGKTWAEKTVKQLTGGDIITARFMRENFWDFAPTHKFWVCANDKPVVQGTDTAIWTRIKLIPCKVSIPKEKQDKALKEKLQAELSGILNWALEGCRLWVESGLQEPAAVTEAVDAYREESDTALDDPWTDKVEKYLLGKKDVTPSEIVRSIQPDTYRTTRVDVLRVTVLLEKLGCVRGKRTSARKPWIVPDKYSVQGTGLTLAEKIRQPS